MFGIGEGLAVAGIASSLVGGSKGQKTPASGFYALPGEVQDAYLKTYLPAVMDVYNQGYQGIPMARVSAPTSPFDSKALYQLQQYSDAIGGLFSPYGRGNKAKSDAEKQAQEAAAKKQSLAQQYLSAMSANPYAARGARLSDGSFSGEIGQNLQSQGISMDKLGSALEKIGYGTGITNPYAINQSAFRQLLGGA